MHELYVKKSSCMASTHSSSICHDQSMLACMCLSKFLTQSMHGWYSETFRSDSGLVVIWFVLSVLGFPHCTAVSRHHAWACLSVPCIFSITCQDSLGVVIKFHWWGSIPVNYAMTVLNPAAWQRSLLAWKEPALCGKRLKTLGMWGKGSQRQCRCLIHLSYSLVSHTIDPNRTLKIPRRRLLMWRMWSCSLLVGMSEIYTITCDVKSLALLALKCGRFF